MSTNQPNPSSTTAPATAPNAHPPAAAPETVPATAPASASASAPASRPATVPATAPADAPPAMEVAGVVGGALAIYGSGFAQKGTLTVGGRTLEPTAWYTNQNTGVTTIKAVVPSDVPKGSAVVVVSAGKTFTGKL